VPHAFIEQDVLQENWIEYQVSAHKLNKSKMNIQIINNSALSIMIGRYSFGGVHVQYPQYLDGLGHVCTQLRHNILQEFADIAYSVNTTIKATHGIKRICEALESNIFVTHLDVSRTQISSIEMRYIAKLMQCNSSITHIDLEYNNIREAGMQHLTKALETNSTLIYLNIDNNYIKKKDLNNIQVRNKCLIMRDKIYQLMFCDLLYHSSLYDSRLLFYSLQFLLEPCTLVPSCLYMFK